MPLATWDERDFFLNIHYPDKLVLTSFTNDFNSILYIAPSYFLQQNIVKVGLTCIAISLPALAQSKAQNPSGKHRCSVLLLQDVNLLQNLDVSTHNDCFLRKSFKSLKHVVSSHFLFHAIADILALRSTSLSVIYTVNLMQMYLLIPYAVLDILDLTMCGCVVDADVRF